MRTLARNRLSGKYKYTKTWFTKHGSSQRRRSVKMVFFEKFCIFHKKTLVLESLFNKVTDGLQPY